MTSWQWFFHHLFEDRQFKDDPDAAVANQSEWLQLVHFHRARGNIWIKEHSFVSCVTLSGCVNSVIFTDWVCTLTFLGWECSWMVRYIPVLFVKGFHVDCLNGYTDLYFHKKWIFLSFVSLFFLSSLSSFLFLLFFFLSFSSSLSPSFCVSQYNDSGF